MVSELCDEKTLECYETAPAEHLLGLCSIKTIISNWSDQFGQSATLMMISILFDGNLIRISVLYHLIMFEKCFGCYGLMETQRNKQTK